jgi:hypothetical protein
MIAGSAISTVSETETRWQKNEYVLAIMSCGASLRPYLLPGLIAGSAANSGGNFSGLNTSTWSVIMLAKGTPKFTAPF